MWTSAVHLRIISGFFNIPRRREDSRRAWAPAFAGETKENAGETGKRMLGRQKRTRGPQKGKIGGFEEPSASSCGGYKQTGTAGPAMCDRPERRKEGDAFKK